MAELARRRGAETMQAERARILEMLAAGTITVDQATLLLDAIAWGGTAARRRGRRPGRRPPAPGRTRGGPAAGRRDGAGFTTDELIQLANHGVTGGHLRALAAAGFDGLGVDDLVRLFDHGVDATYLQELREAGLTHDDRLGCRAEQPRGQRRLHPGDAGRRLRPPERPRAGAALEPRRRAGLPAGDGRGAPVRRRAESAQHPPHPPHPPVAMAPPAARAARPPAPPVPPVARHTGEGGGGECAPA